ncbi:MAG: heavy metal-responsive transcriptional regulator [Thermoanaerobaculia bacterium]
MRRRARTSTLGIGELAALTDVSVPTIRYYEQIGLLPEAARTASGYRRFPPEAARRLRFIRRAQQLGFSLDEIRELLELRATEGPAADRAAVRARTEAKLAELEAKIADLEAMRKALRRLHRACCEGGTTSTCPILDALER